MVLIAEGPLEPPPSDPTKPKPQYTTTRKKPNPSGTRAVKADKLREQRVREAHRPPKGSRALTRNSKQVRAFPAAKVRRQASQYPEIFQKERPQPTSKPPRQAT